MTIAGATITLPRLALVGNNLELLRLHPSILGAIERLPIGAGNEVTERRN